MAESETLEIIVRMRDLAGKGLKGLSNGLDGVRSKIASVADAAFSLKAMFIQLTAGISFGLLAREFVQTASAFEGWRTRLTRVLGSVEEGNKLFGEMKELAKESTAEYSAIMDAATNMAGVMKGGVEETKKYMKIADDLAAVTGLSIQDATSQIIRMYSAGAQSADLFRERGVLAMLGFQAGVSYSAEETRKKLVEAWESPTSKIRGASQDLANTFTGLLSMIADEWQDFQVSVMESGVFDYLKAVVATVLDTIREMRGTGEFQAFQNNVGKYIIGALEKVAYLGAIVGDIFRGWQMIWDGLKLAFGGMFLAIASGLETVWQWIIDINDKLYTLGKLLNEMGLTTLGDDFIEVADGINKSVGAAKERASEAKKFWGEVFDEAEMHLGQVAAEESYWKKVEKILAKVRDRAAEFRKAAEEGPANLAGRQGEKEAVASLESRLKAQITVQKAQISMALTTLEILYKQGSVTLEEYFNERERLLNERYAKEIALAQEAVRLAETPDKRVVAEANVDALKIKQQEELLKLQETRSDAEKKLGLEQIANERMLAEMRAGVMQEGEEKERALFDARLIELKARQMQEIELLKNQKATEEQINEAHRLHEKQKEQELADFEHTLWQNRLQNASTVAGGLSDIFGDLYEQSGESVKEFFYLQKAAALAEALINAQVAASNALKEGGTYMGPILAALHYAKAMMYVAQIRAQKLAGGGEVQGYSPSATADNIPIQATAGEFMQPVSSVRYYGKGIMEAMRKKMIPKELFDGMRVPTVKRHYGHGFAAGGPVTGQDGGGAGRKEDITIVNTPDPNLLERYLASNTGKRTLLNVIRMDAYEFRTALSEA